MSIHQLIQGGPPQVLMRPEFEAERTAMKALGTEIRAQLDAGKDPDAALVDKALTAIDALEAKADSILKNGTRDRVDADRYLKSLHGLVAMLKTPAIDTILAGVEKRPDVTLGQLLNFMNVFNLRFGPANTPEQRQAYNTLWPKIDGLRDQVVTSLASAAPVKASGTEPGEFFNDMSYEDLRKKAPAPPKPAAPR
ncbi:MAG: hypothetical protein U0794_10615 [Isosphaeraceae bacterium]